MRGRRRFLSGPIVDIPIVLIQEEVVLLELLRRHLCKVGVCEGGEEEITFECTPLAALIYKGRNLVSGCILERKHIVEKRT